MYDRKSKTQSLFRLNPNKNIVCMLPEMRNNVFVQGYKRKEVLINKSPYHKNIR